MAAKSCCHAHADGRPCRATPMRDAAFCFWHDPDKSEEAAEARRLGGLRRKREKMPAGAYDVGGLGDVASVRRVLEIAVLDALGLDNSIARSKVLIGAAGVAAQLLEAEREAGWGWDDDACSGADHDQRGCRDVPLKAYRMIGSPRSWIERDQCLHVRAGGLGDLGSVHGR